jgi:hypothetical protein
MLHREKSLAPARDETCRISIIFSVKGFAAAEKQILHRTVIIAAHAHGIPDGENTLTEREKSYMR